MGQSAMAISELSSATRDVVGEARASIKGSSTFGRALSLFRGSSDGAPR